MPPQVAVKARLPPLRCYASRDLITFCFSPQVAVNGKASALALTNVDKCLRGVGREMVLMGKPPDVVGGRHEPAGILYGTALGR